MVVSLRFDIRTIQTVQTHTYTHSGVSDSATAKFIDIHVHLHSCTCTQLYKDCVYTAGLRPLRTPSKSKGRTSTELVPVVPVINSLGTQRSCGDGR